MHIAIRMTAIAKTISLPQVRPFLLVWYLLLLIFSTALF